MLTHYLKIAFRNILKYKTQSLTGIFGLAFAIACFVPALYWMHYETTFDSFYPDAEYIYRIYTLDKQSGKVNERVPGALGKKLQENVPGAENVAYFIPEMNNCKTVDVPHIRLQMLNTDSTFFRIFKQEFICGDVVNPLQTMFNIVLTERTAIALFGGAEQAIGKQIQSTYYFFNPPYTVTAVVKDPPKHTNMPFDALYYNDFLHSILNMEEEYQWIECMVDLYVKLPTQVDVTHFAEQVHGLTTRLNVETTYEFQVMPISEVRHRLSSDMPFTMSFIQLFVAAGILLMFSAVFNFLNLYLDLFRQRIRELRQRTVHGAKSRQLIRQMLFELGCSILLALVFGACFVGLVSPVFSGLLGVEMKLPELMRLFLVCGVGVMALILIVGLITFWRLSRMALQPLSKGKTAGQLIFRRAAVILQLAVSIVFIVAAFVVMMQIRFVNHKDLGFDTKGIIQLYGLQPYIQTDLKTAILDKLRTIPQVKSISATNFDPQHHAKTEDMVSRVEWPGKSPTEESGFNIIPVDEHFAEVFGLQILDGKWYKEGSGQSVVLNEEALRVMELTDPVGTNLRISIYDADFEIVMYELDVNYRIAGIVKDFHTLSLRSRIYPTIFRNFLPPRPGRVADNNIIYMSVTPGQEQEAIQRITAILPEIDPSFADLRVMTLDELYNSFNRSEQAGFEMFSVLAAVCLLISLVGIYAVATASTQRRRKEIAIRKVMGAGVRDIIRIFFSEYTLQVVIAGVVALPLAYIAMSRWLQGYAYRTDIPWWLLVGVMVGVVAVVLLTVLGQVLKAARSNPAEVVKSE